jgi:hypothetical protein
MHCAIRANSEQHRARLSAQPSELWSRALLAPVSWLQLVAHKRRCIDALRCVGHV